MWILTILGCWGDKPVAGSAIGPGDERPVWMFQYGDGGWTRREKPVAHSASSLGLGVVDDRLILTMQCFWDDCGSEAKRREIGPPVHWLSTTDLQTFEPGMARLVDPDDRVPIDTEMRQVNGSSLVWYFGAHAGMMGDPAKQSSAHGIYRATVEGSRLVRPEKMLSGTGLADPAPLQVRGGQVVFITTVPGHQIGMATGEPLTVQKRWERVSVPHAMTVKSEIWLWAQTVRAGKMIPVLATSGDGGQSWSEWASPLPLQGLEGCGNPVGAVFKEPPVVFCVTEPLGGPQK